MENPISIFIMDVTGSSTDGKVGQELESYLKEIVYMVRSWSEEVVNIKISHRQGDELILISENYSTAYTIAFYLSRIWKFSEHKPYFGLTFGNINKRVKDIEIETWIHPLVKQARTANNELKHLKEDRKQFKFKLDISNQNKHLPSPSSPEVNHYLSTVESLINTLLENQHILFTKQTELQELIADLYLIFMQQKKIAVFLNKTGATISSHINRGYGKEIIKNFNRINEALNSIQMSIFQSTLQQNQTKYQKQLEENIRVYVNNHIDSLFSNRKF
ncbi:hypothetical protein CV093_16835 [Oceanobacillus sp. 143]|uniref:Uncharacterized protein n=1 Tax=Oceanobacillus zhaokaii TaxID=2052660 RepID=A0A345PJX1_9BACI|nr:hypothetical protein [Oceanobacillus zhaokaii]AXI10301.1 hypothetical protein CUC15_15780 [Oceanobacillus zhaokaii]QGS69354.1 hypothetical protein CV093_16835 [Oceanobacillus sp. 143]